MARGSLIEAADGFRIESDVLYGVPNQRSAIVQPVSKFTVEHTRERWYRSLFLDHEHLLYVGRTPTLGAVALAVLHEASVGAGGEQHEHIRALLFSKKGRKMSHFESVGKKQDAISRIAVSCGFESREFNDLLLLKASARAKLAEELERLERMETPERLIIGVVNGTGEQREMDDMWGNRESSAAFWRFMNLLGKEVDLAELGDSDLTRFSGFGGASPDERALIYRTSHGGYDIIFHVSALLPYSVTDAQQLVRKRKIGNDIGVIVFSESTRAFLPSLASSKVNHVLCAVRPDDAPAAETQRYSLGMAVKSDVPAFGPALKATDFADARSFRDLVLTKMVNGMHAAYQNAPGFKREETTRALLEDMVERFASDAKWQSWSKTNKRKQRAVLMTDQRSANCAECHKPVTTETGVSALGAIFHAEHFVCAHCAKPFNNEPYFVHATDSRKAYCENDYVDLFCPRCAHCNEQVDVFVRALGKAWHMAHFCCAACEIPIGEDVFFERDGHVYCQSDYSRLFGEPCARCANLITESHIEFMGKKYHADCHRCSACDHVLQGPSVFAFERAFHPNCFVCRDCSVPLGTSAYHVVDGEAFCETHWHTRNGTLCQECGKPCREGAVCVIESRHWHAEHFNCFKCKAHIPDASPFGLVDDQPTCPKCIA